mmetsp:Transcript_8223/g.14896  ORF Transcript_8223/g.14896 Transcript_8223/m.14896 type:complete len:296 (+) Transcript_8223:74-961(+)
MQPAKRQRQLDDEHKWKLASQVTHEPNLHLPYQAPRIVEFAEGRFTVLTAPELLRRRGPRKETLLFEAINEENYDAAWWLLCNGAAAALQPDTHGRIPILAAAQRGNLALVKSLLGACAHDKKAHSRMITWKCASGNQAPMLNAARSGNLELCEYLYQHGAARDVSWINSCSNTCMYFAATRGYDDVCRWLLLRGAQPRMSDFGCTSSKGREKAALVRSVLNHFTVGEIRASGAFQLALGCTTDEYEAGNSCGAASGGAFVGSQLHQQPTLVRIRIIGYLGLLKGTECVSCSSAP